MVEESVLREKARELAAVNPFSAEVCYEALVAVLSAYAEDEVFGELVERELT